MDPVATIADTGACGAALAAAVAYGAGHAERMAGWLLTWTAFGGVAGIGRVLAEIGV